MEEQIKALLEQNRQLLVTLSEKKSSSEKVSVQFEKFQEETEDFETFLERFDSYLDIQKVPEDLRAKVLITSLSPKLYKLLKNLLAPDIPSDQPLDKLKETLKKHLNPKPLIIPSRHKFLNRKQYEGESINSFIAELRALAINCNYDSTMLNIMLRDVFVSGLRDKHILDRLFEEDNIDLEKTVQIALAMEKAVKGANDIMGQGINAVYASKQNRNTKNQNKKYFDSKKKSEFCSRCTGSDHTKNYCRFINSKCDFCSKIGHIKKACFAAKKANAKPAKQKQVRVNHTGENKKEVPVLKLHTSNDTLREVEPKQPPIMINVKIEDKSCSMELDTGGTVSVMSIENFRKISNKKIQPTDLTFRTYNGESLIPMGYVTVKVGYKEQNLKLNLYIVKENLDTILGREWLSKLKLDWNGIKSVRTIGKRNLNKLLEEYKDIFDDKLGEISNHEVKLELKQGVKPVFRRFRTVPFALKDRIEKEIDRLEKEGIIEKAECSEWATPVVPVVKPDGSIRLCADFSVTLNPNLNVPQHPLPRLEEIFSSLNGGQQFSKLDFKHAYLQMKVHPDSQKLLTINTHKGLFICKRLMYGLNGAPAIWQRYVDGLFHGIEGVKVFMDDARITGVDENSHLLALETFFKKCREQGLKLNLNKSKFFQNEINFLGHKVDSKGLHKTNDKILAILKAPVPKNVQEVKSFLGLVNFYGKFCKNLATIANPLNKLTQKDVIFKWSKQCQDAFKKIKQEICSDRILVHYDPKKSLTLATDASPVGIGCVLSHLFPDGTERPIAFASRTLTKTEEKYSQIDKEALAIVWAVQKFHLYLKGRRFTLITDHKPLVSIFGCKRGLPVLTATRLLHYALILQSFQFDIKYRNTKDHGNADFLSRLPETSENFEIQDDVRIFQLSQIETLPVTSKELGKATGNDEELGPLLKALRKGQDLQGREAQYSIEDNCLMYGSRVCIPKIYQNAILKELHEGHLGMVKMKAIARSYIYWKGIDLDIEEVARNCADCVRHKTDPAKAKVHYWEYPSKPWERIHVDFAGPIFEHMFLVIVDAHSKWLEVYDMKTTTTEKTIESLRDCFSRYGLPVVLVSDNGPQFTAHEFKKFMSDNGIKHITSAPFKPSSNGQAERYVHTLKQSLRAMRDFDGSIKRKLSIFLLKYRIAPNSTTMHSPAMLFLKREIRTRFDLLLPDMKSKIQEKLRKNEVVFRDRVFAVGDSVAIRIYGKSRSKWKVGKVVSKDGALTYTINVQGTLARRHVDQIRPAGDQLVSCDDPVDFHKIPNLEFVNANEVKKSTSVVNEEQSKDLEEPTPVSPISVLPDPGPMPSTVSADSTVVPDSSPPHVDTSVEVPAARNSVGTKPEKTVTVPRRSGRARKPPKRLDL